MNKNKEIAISIFLLDISTNINENSIYCRVIAARRMFDWMKKEKRVRNHQ